MWHQQTYCKWRLKRYVYTDCVLPSWNTDLELPHKKFSPVYWGIRDSYGRNRGTPADCYHRQPDMELKSPWTFQPCERSYLSNPGKTSKATTTPTENIIGRRSSLSTWRHFRIVCYRATNTWHTKKKWFKQSQEL